MADAGRTEGGWADILDGLAATVYKSGDTESKSKEERMKARGRKYKIGDCPLFPARIAKLRLAHTVPYFV